MAYFRSNKASSGGGMPHGYLYYNVLTYNGTINQTVLYHLHENSIDVAVRNPATGFVLIDNDDLKITKTSTTYVFQAQFKKACRVYVYDSQTETVYSANDTLNLSSNTSYRIMFDV